MFNIFGPEKWPPFSDDIARLILNENYCILFQISSIDVPNSLIGDNQH